MITDKDASPIYDALMKLPKRGRLLEIGTGRGDSALFFALLKPKWAIYTVDLFGVVQPLAELGELNKTEPRLYYPSERDVNAMFERWKNHRATNIIPIISNSVNLHWELELDALFIDGDHLYEGVKSDFDKFSPFVKKGGIIIFHDATVDADYCQVPAFIEKEVKKDWSVIIKANVAVARRKNG